MTREFKVGMTGKTTAGNEYLVRHVNIDGSINADINGDAYRMRAYRSDGTRSIDDAAALGDLIHPDDAKEEQDDMVDSFVMALDIASGKDSTVHERVHVVSIEDRRFQAACAALTGLLSNHTLTEGARVASGGDGKAFERLMAGSAIAHGDALLTRLSDKSE